ncbi:hypothetical protein Aperf_G00000079452 [Anoplocephala perfoliata]
MLLGNLDGADLGVLLGYFVVVFAVGIWSSCRNRGTVGGYFLAGRSMNWIPADLYAGGLFIQQAMQISIYPAVILLLVISALFTIMGGLTAVIWTDFAQTVIMIVGAFYLTIRSLHLTGGLESMFYHYLNAIPNTTRVYRSTLFKPDRSNFTSLNPDLYGSNMDRQVILKLADSEAAKQGIYAECQIPSSSALNLFKSASSDVLPWTGSVFGLTISSTWYWCTDQVIVQRTLAAKNLSHARGGIILASVLKILPLWLMVVPGMTARVLFADTVACGSASVCKEVCGKPVGCSDIAYPSLVLNVLPSGARGLMLAVMMASLVSSLTSIFNSASTIFTVDIWKLIRPECSDAEVMIVGRVCVIILVGIGIAWLPIVQLSDELFNYIQSVTGYLAPPICAVYVLAVIWKRTNEIGCFTALVIGLFIGLTRFGWELAYAKTPCGEAIVNPPHYLLKLHYLHFTIILFAITFLVAICVSLISPPLPPSYTRRLVFSEINTPFDRDLDGPKLNVVSDEEKQRWLESAPEKPNPSGWRKIFNWFCGIEKMQDSREPVFTPAEAEVYLQEVERQSSIEESFYQREEDSERRSQQLVTVPLQYFYICKAVFARSLSMSANIIYENETTGQISLYYALSFLTSNLVCQHYKLVPRLQSFQLGERLFQCLKCILSRYYQCPLIPGEYLRVPIPPCSPPQEFYTRRVRAIRKYEPPCNLRLGCKPDDEFLVVDDESHSDWMLVTSVQTRQSGYLPKFCLEKVYPDIIERLAFFHEDSTALEQQELLKQNGPFSYLLRLCDSDPGLYTLLVYDGTRILKYKIATSIVWWATPQPHEATYKTTSSNASSTTTPALNSVDSGNVAADSEGATTSASDTSSVSLPQTNSQSLPFTKPLYKSVVKIRYNSLWYTSVENVVSAIEAQFNQPNSQYQPAVVELKPIHRGPKPIPSQDSIYMAISFNRRPSSPRAIVEIHGELSLWVPQKKKWKPLYASLDREQSIITLTGGDKRKPERIDLSRCDFFPVHPLMFDKKHCFGLLLTSTGEREDYVFSVEPPYSYANSQTSTSTASCVPTIGSSFTSSSNPSTTSLRLQHGFSSTPNSAVNTNNNGSVVGGHSTNTNANNNSSGSGSGVNNNGFHPASATATAASELDPQAYAGRSDTTGNIDLAGGCPRFCGFGEVAGSTWSKIPSASTVGGVTSAAGGSNSMGSGSIGGPSPIDVAYMRWLKALAAHCRNTREESAVDADPERRRSEVRCFRTLEVKLKNAKLLPMPPLVRREGGGIYSVTVDGLEIARAYSGSTNQTITFEEFPSGYKKVEVTYREDKKKRQPSIVLTKLELINRRHSGSTNTSNTQTFSLGSSPSLEVATLLGAARGRGRSSEGTPVAEMSENQSQSLTTSQSQPQQHQQQIAQAKNTPICCFQESVSPQATLIYRELYVLPFQCYDKLRKVITTHLETELVPACTFMWAVLASDHNNFQSSLLLACIESKRHLELIFNLLKAVIPADQPTQAFRSAGLGQLIMEQYMNMVCSEWRQKCFRRVFNEIAKGPPPPPSTITTTTSLTSVSTSPPTTTATCTAASSTSRSVRFSSGVEKSVSESGEISSSSGSGSCNIPSGPELHGVSSYPSQHHRDSSPVTSTRSDTSGQSEWYSSLVELLIDDFIEYAKEFPLQIRWIYSELQKCPELKSTNAVWCNLLFLRGICPSICTGTYGPATESPVRDSKALTTIAKNLITLTNQMRSDNALSLEVFESCRSKLVNKFAPHVLPIGAEVLD